MFKNRQLYKPLREAMRDALMNCADIASPVPIFTDEPSQLADVLDIILVDWTDSLPNMISSSYGRYILRRFVQEALSRLEAASDYLGNNRTNFRYEMVRLWRRRARLYYDGHNDQLPYIRHAYSVHRGIHTYGNLANLYTRSVRNFNVRNPLLNNLKVIDLLNLHDADGPDYVFRENNIFV